METLKESIIKFILKNDSNADRKNLELLSVTQLVIMKTQLELKNKSNN